MSKRTLPEISNDQYAILVKRYRVMRPDAKAICLDGEVPFLFDVVRQGSEVLNDMMKELGDCKIITIKKSTEITKFVFDYVQFGVFPEHINKIAVLNDVFSMADEYRVQDLCDHIRKYLEEIINDNATAVFIHITDKLLSNIRDKAYVKIRDRIRNAYHFACDTCS